MTQDEIIEMARQAGFPFNKYDLLQGDDEGEIDAHEMFEAFAKLVAAKERLEQPEQEQQIETLKRCLFQMQEAAKDLVEQAKSLTPPQRTEQEPVNFEKLAALGWQAMECNICGGGAMGYPQRTEQEPLAWISPSGALYRTRYHAAANAEQSLTPLYTHPPQRIEQNFCSRCGKRTPDLTHIHTCTTPKD